MRLQIHYYFSIQHQDGPFDAYKDYASLVPQAVELLSKVMIMTPTLIDFLEAPLYHLRNIRILVNKVVKASIKSGIDTVDVELIRTIANLQKELSNFCKMVHDTFIIHSKIGEITVIRKNDNEFISKILMI